MIVVLLGKWNWVGVVLGVWNLKEISQTLSGLVAQLFNGLGVELEIW
jgi:hypothetical protein